MSIFTRLFGRGNQQPEDDQAAIKQFMVFEGDANLKAKHAPFSASDMWVRHLVTPEMLRYMRLNPGSRNFINDITRAGLNTVYNMDWFGRGMDDLLQVERDYLYRVMSWRGTVTFVHTHGIADTNSNTLWLDTKDQNYVDFNHLRRDLGRLDDNMAYIVLAACNTDNQGGSIRLARDIRSTVDYRHGSVGHGGVDLHERVPFDSTEPL